MMSVNSNQIFENPELNKQKMFQIKKIISEMNLSSEIRKLFKIIDKYDLLINNFIYLLRLNQMNFKDYWEEIIFIKLIYADYFCRHILNKNYQLADNKKMNEKIKHFKNKIKYKLKMNLESDLLKSNNIKLTDDNKWFFSHHIIYQSIANIFYNVFANEKNAIDYYKYAYDLTVIFTLDNFTKVFRSKTLLENKPLLYILKLSFFNDYEKSISSITNLYFNYFVCQNNFFFNKNRKNNILKNEI